MTSARMLVWSHALEHQLTESAKNLLIVFVLASLPSEVFLEDWKQAFETFHRKQAGAHRLSTTPRDFKNALKELDSNFTAVDKSRDRVVLRFHNPSVRDFVLNYLRSSEEDLSMLLDSCVFFNQLSLLWNIEDHGTPMFRDALKERTSPLALQSNVPLTVLIANWSHSRIAKARIRILGLYSSRAELKS
jgi:hypothetical protein